MELQLFYSLLSHLVLEYLSCGIHGEAVYEINVSRALVLCHSCKAEVLDLLFRSCFSVLKNDTSHYFLTVVLVGNSDHLYVLNLGICIEKGYQGGRKEIEDRGYDVTSIAIVESMNAADGSIVFK